MLRQFDHDNYQARVKMVAIYFYTATIQVCRLFSKLNLRPKEANLYYKRPRLTSGAL